jgi:hypothetical protein
MFQIPPNTHEPLVIVKLFNRVLVGKACSPQRPLGHIFIHKRTPLVRRDKPPIKRTVHHDEEVEGKLEVEKKKKKLINLVNHWNVRSRIQKVRRN